MRPIEFRAKRIDNGEWVYGYYAKWQGDDVVFPLDPMGKMRKVDPSTVGQFTGLHDKNGNKIWEGDIVKGNHEDPFIVEEFNGGLQIYNSRYYGQRYNDLIAMPTCDPQTKSWLLDSEIIGNIHENPHTMTPLSEKAKEVRNEMKKHTNPEKWRVLEYSFEKGYHTRNEELQAELTRLKKEVEELRGSKSADTSKCQKCGSSDMHYERQGIDIADKSGTSKDVCYTFCNDCGDVVNL